VTMAEQSIVEFFADHSGSSCGYCHSSAASYSHGVFYGAGLLLYYNIYILCFLADLYRIPHIYIFIVSLLECLTLIFSMQQCCSR